MRLHTSYRIGGPADIYAEPLDENELKEVVSAAINVGVAYFILGGGSNILVSDKGIRGMVISLEHVRHLEINDKTCRVGAGMAMSDIVEYTCIHGLKGLESFYAMPGDVGGAVWMNARCYGVSISEMIAEIRVLDPGSGFKIFIPKEEDFDYKKSPFQKNGQIILEVLFNLEKADKDDLIRRMAEVRQDRIQKGHYLSPSAGSVFKNNRSFGKPSGMIIDSLGLRGYRIGEAVVSPQHANFIINTGDASARDVKALIDHIMERVKEAYGYQLEPEVLLVGEWEET